MTALVRMKRTKKSKMFRLYRLTSTSITKMAQITVRKEESLRSKWPDPRKCQLINANRINGNSARIMTSLPLMCLFQMIRNNNKNCFPHRIYPTPYFSQNSLRNKNHKCRVQILFQKQTQSFSLTLTRTT